MHESPVPYTKNYQDQARRGFSAQEVAGIGVGIGMQPPEPSVVDGIASCISQTDQLLARLETALERLRPTPKSAGGPSPIAAGLVQQTVDLATRLQYACKLTEEVCAAVGI